MFLPIVAIVSDWFLIFKWWAWITDIIIEYIITFLTDYGYKYKRKLARITIDDHSASFSRYFGTHSVRVLLPGG